MPPEQMEPKQSETTSSSDKQHRCIKTGDGERRSWGDVAMEAVNNHLQLFRMLPWVMGGLGLLLIAKYSRMFVRYRKASDVPAHLISRGVTLRGVAVGVWPDGRLDIWHTPHGRRWLHWNHLPPDPCPPGETLSVRLAAVDLRQPDQVSVWIHSNLIGRSIRLQALHHCTTDDTLQCILYYRKGYSSPRLKCANIQLLSLGLASLKDPSAGHHGDGGYHSNKRLIAFLSEGVRVESGAQRRGEGVWRGSVHETMFSRTLRFLRLRK